jgi:hypothetical protein
MNDNRRVFEYVTMGRPPGPTAQGSIGEGEGPVGANEQVLKTPGRSTKFSVYSKSADVATTALLTIDGAFTHDPAPEDLLNIVTDFDVSPAVLTEVLADQDLEFPYLKLTYVPGDPTMSSEVYIGFY